MNEESQSSHIETLIIGAGVAGLGQALYFHERGYHNYLILEKEAYLGGVWGGSLYPEATCDSPNSTYSFSFVRPWNWPRRYPTQQDVLEYLRSLVRTHKLEERLRFHCEVANLRFDKDSGIWTTELSDGRVFTSRFVIFAVGQLSKINLPSLAGAETFHGPSFHTAEWPSDFQPEGKKVAVIGTGASAAQCVEYLAKNSAEVLLFQKEPAYVLDKWNVEYGKWYRAAQLTRLFSTARRFLENFYKDLIGIGFNRAPALVNLRRQQFIEELKSQINDQELLKKVIPTERIGCKRIIRSSSYYEILNSGKAKLITEEITSINEQGILTSQDLYPTDAIIYATGYQPFFHLKNMKVQSSTTRDFWSAAKDAYLGIFPPEYSNLFILSGVNTSLPHNSVIRMFEQQFRQVHMAIQEVHKKSAVKFTLKSSVSKDYCEFLQERNQQSVWANACHSWYFEDDRNIAIWPFSYFRYWNRARRFRAKLYDFN